MEEEIKLEKRTEDAKEIIMNKIAQITNEYSTTKEEIKSKELKEKVDVLNKIKEEIYLGNTDIINNVIEKNRKGML